MSENLSVTNTFKRKSSAERNEEKKNQNLHELSTPVSVVDIYLKFN